MAGLFLEMGCGRMEGFGRFGLAFDLAFDLSGILLSKKRFRIFAIITCISFMKLRVFIRFSLVLVGFVCILMLINLILSYVSGCIHDYLSGCIHDYLSGCTKINHILKELILYPNMKLLLCRIKEFFSRWKEMIQTTRDGYHENFYN